MSIDCIDQHLVKYPRIHQNWSNLCQVNTEKKGNHPSVDKLPEESKGLQANQVNLVASSNSTHSRIQLDVSTMARINPWTSMNQPKHGLATLRKPVGRQRSKHTWARVILGPIIQCWNVGTKKREKTYHRRPTISYRQNYPLKIALSRQLPFVPPERRCVHSVLRLCRPTELYK